MFSHFFTAFLKYSCNFEHFEIKDETKSLCVAEITDGERNAYVNA